MQRPTQFRSSDFESRDPLLFNVAPEQEQRHHRAVALANQTYDARERVNVSFDVERITFRMANTIHITSE